MKKRISKATKEIYDKQMELVIPLFEDYFTRYYSENRKVKSYSFYTMEDMRGYSVILEYDNFRQYINYFVGKGVFGDNLVNACFELDYNGNRFLCHFSDILNVLDSEDLSFYTYENCLVKEDVEAALNGITRATEKYYDSISNIALSQNKTRKIYEAYFDDYEDSLDKVEDTTDFDYAWYGGNTSYDELSKELSIDFKAGELEDDYAKRAYRVLNNMSRSELKKAEKKRASKSSLPLSSKIIIAAPYIVFIIIFSVAFAFLFGYIDRQIYSECVERNSYTSSLIGVFLGGVCGAIAFSLFPPSVYKLLAKGEKYDGIEQALYAGASNSPWGYVLVIGGGLLICSFFICVFTFNGVGFTDNSAIYKEYVFSQKEEYSFENMSICEIESTYNEGSYSEYGDTAYALRFGEEWYELGVPNSDEMKIIQDNIKKYDIKIDKAYSIDDIENSDS